MPDNEPDSHSLDVLGVKGLSDSVKIATKGLIDGAGAFLSRVCLPAAEEFGLILRDRVSSWRAKNATRMLNRANELHLATGAIGGTVNPRLVHIAIEQGSWTDDSVIQDMWAGLLSSAVMERDPSDENLIFMNLLLQLSALQVRILNYAVGRASKYSAYDLPLADEVTMPVDELSSATGGPSLHRLDRELDHLRALGLIGSSFGGGINVESGAVDVTPTPLAINLFVRSQGSTLSATEYFRLKPRQKTATGPG